MEKLGIEPSLLLAQIVNFAIIMIVLTKLLYKPILGMLEKRKQAILDNQELSEKLAKDEEITLEKREKILETARKEGQVIILEAEKRAKEEEKAILREAHSEAEEILKKAKAESEQVKKDMEKTMREEAIGLSEVMAKRLLTGVLKESEQHKILGMHIRELKTIRK